MLKSSAFALLLLAASAAHAQVPGVHIPAEIALEVSLVERAFESALAADCAPERCFSKGCVYGRHQTIDQPRATSLPGLPTEEGIGSVPTQEYLTEARCEFTYEKSVSPKDIASLQRRLELRLSRGWRKVTVTPQLLEPINKALAEPTMPPEDKPKEDEAQKEPEPTPPPPPPPAPTEPPEFTSDVALRELWTQLLPHLPWMIAIFLMTLAIFALIWASRRLGAPTIEEKMLEAQIAQPPPPEPEPEPVVEQKPDEEHSWAEQQENKWMERLADVKDDDDGPLVELLREWLKTGDFPMLARAAFVFGDRISTAFSTDSELALKKIEFAEYFRDVDEEKLPSRAEFFRRLNQHALSSLLLAQDDVQLYRSLREDFGSGGIVSLMQQLPQRFGALLFALVPRETQYDVARMMPPDLRVIVADQLLASSRISREESAHLFACISAARDGEPLPKPPRASVTDRGPAIDAAAALSVLLPHIDAVTRTALFTRALHGSTSAPQWFEDIFYGEMLAKLAPEQRADLLLDVDVRGLAAWLSLQDQEWQRALTSSLSPSMQTALRGNSTFASRAEQQSLARRGHASIITALKGQYARGKASFLALVA